jgi:hypothetical protein
MWHIEYRETSLWYLTKDVRIVGWSLFRKLWNNCEINQINCRIIKFRIFRAVINTRIETPAKWNWSSYKHMLSFPLYFLAAWGGCIFWVYNFWYAYFLFFENSGYKIDFIVWFEKKMSLFKMAFGIKVGHKYDMHYGSLLTAMPESSCLVSNMGCD